MSERSRLLSNDFAGVRAVGDSNLADRENVVNLHIGIPHRRDAGRDDVQLLYNVIALQSQYYSSPTTSART